MALQKTYTDSAGNSGDYQRIQKFGQDQDADSFWVMVSIYKSQADRDANKDPMYSKRYDFNAFTIGEMDPLNQNIIERAYEELKLHTDFTGATDILE